MRRQRGRVVRGSDLESRSPGFKSRSDRLLELFLGSLEFNSSASFVNSELTQQDGWRKGTVNYNRCVIFRRFLTKTGVLSSVTTWKPPAIVMLQSRVINTWDVTLVTQAQFAVSPHQPSSCVNSLIARWSASWQLGFLTMHVMLYSKYLFLPVRFIVPEKPLFGRG